MSRKKIQIPVDLPLLHGSVTTARSQCGKPNCACKDDPPKLHGEYYRWTGVIDGKRTTKTIPKEVADECLRRIANYRKLQRRIHKILEKGMADAPWKPRKSR